MGDARQEVLCAPQLRLVGSVDEAMYAEFRNQLGAAPAEGPLVVAVTTLGGDPEIARCMADDTRLLREAGRTVHFLGKATVYSAGVTFMAGFPVECRHLTRGTSLLIHERQMTRSVELSGPLKSCTDQLRAVLNEIEHSVWLEEEGFRALAEGSRLSMEEIIAKAPANWYMNADEALEHGLVATVL